MALFLAFADASAFDGVLKILTEENPTTCGMKFYSKDV